MDFIITRLQSAREQIQEAKAKLSGALHSKASVNDAVPHDLHDFSDTPSAVSLPLHVENPDGLAENMEVKDHSSSSINSSNPQMGWNGTGIQDPQSISNGHPSSIDQDEDLMGWDGTTGVNDHLHLVNDPAQQNANNWGNPQPDGLDVYDGLQGGELHPDEPGDGLDDYHGHQGGQIGTIPDNATGGPNSISTGHTSNSGSGLDLDAHTLDGVANTDSSSAGTMHTESTTLGLEVDAVIVNGSLTGTSTTTEQVTHNADGTSVVSSQTDIDGSVGAGGSVIVASGDVSTGLTDTHIIENSGPTDVVQDSIAANGGIIDTSDVSAVPEGMTVTEIGNPGFDVLGSGTTESAGASLGLSAEVGIGNANAEVSLDQSTGTITNTSQSGLDTTTVTNTGESTIVGSGETSIHSTEYSVEANQTGVSVGGVGTITSDTMTISNTTQHTETFDIAHDNSANGLASAQAQADSGNAILGEDGQYDHTVQTTNTHTETLSQGTIQGSAEGDSGNGNHSDGNPIVTNQEVEQQTTITHMQGNPGQTPDLDNGFFDLTESDTNLGQSSDHTITESPQNGQAGFTVGQNSNGSIPLAEPIETVTASTSTGVTIEGTPEEIQASAQEVLQSNPDNPVLQDLANGVSLPEAVHNDANTGFENITIGHDNTNTTEALEAIAEEQALQDDPVTGSSTSTTTETTTTNTSTPTYGGTGSNTQSGGSVTSGSSGTGGGGADSGSSGSGSSGTGGGGADSGSSGSGSSGTGGGDFDLSQD